MSCFGRLLINVGGRNSISIKTITQRPYLHNPRRNSHHHSTLRHRLQYNRIRPHTRTSTHKNRPQYLRPRTHNHTITQSRMPLAATLLAAVLRRRNPAKRHSLIQSHIIANLTRLPNHNTHPMINEKSLANHRRRMYLHPRQPPRQGHQHPRRRPKASPPHRMRQPIPQHRMKPRINQHNLQRVARGRVARAGGTHISRDFCQKRHSRDPCILSRNGYNVAEFPHRVKDREPASKALRFSRRPVPTPHLRSPHV